MATVAVETELHRCDHEVEPGCASFQARWAENPEADEVICFEGMFKRTSYRAPDGRVKAQFTELRDCPFWRERRG